MVINTDIKKRVQKGNLTLYLKKLEKRRTN